MVELTERQEQIYALICDGASYAQIGAELGLTPRTIEGYVKSLADRLPGTGPPLRKILRFALTDGQNGTKT